jgi:hypothetical protein
LIPAQKPEEFADLSKILKWVMLAGILSLLFFYFLL